MFLYVVLYLTAEVKNLAAGCSAAVNEHERLAVVNAGST